MTLPAQITNAAEWSDFKACFHGPHASRQGTLLVQVATSNEKFNIGNSSGQQLVAQKFMPTSTKAVGALAFWLEKFGSPTDNVTCEIRTASGSSPSTTVLASGSVAASLIPSTASKWIFFVLDAEVTLTASTTYWIVLGRSGAPDASNFYEINIDNMAPYSGDGLKYYNGSSWLANQFYDMRFSVYGEPFSDILYIGLVDKVNNKARMYRSADGGHIWAEEDAANAKEVSATVGEKSLHTVSDGRYVYGFRGGGGTTAITYDTFDMYANTWALGTGFGLAAAGPHIATGRAILGARRSDNSAAIFYNGATESIMGTAYRRLKVAHHVFGSTWNGPFDVVGSANTPLANTLPGTQLHYDLRAVIRGASDRVIVFYSEVTSAGTSGALRCRVLLSDNTFAAAAIQIGSETVSNAAYSVGFPCTYLDGAATDVALPYASGSTGKVARCDTAGAETDGNWSTETFVSEALEQTLSNPACVFSDVTKVWAMFVTDTGEDLAYVHDQGVSSWTGRQLWKEGDAVIIGGVNAAKITDAVGVVYLDSSVTPARVRYDRLVLFKDKVGTSTGTTTKTVDLGVDDPGPTDVVWDIGAGADPAGTIDILVESSPDGVSGWREEGRGGADASQSEGGIRLSSPMRHVRITAGVANFASTVGVTGV